MLSDFYSIVQLLATLTIGFVILDYSDFFTKVLKTKFFHADETLKKAKDDCKLSVPDKTSFDELHPTNVGNGNTNKDIEELRRSCEKMVAKIDKYDETSNENLKVIQLRSLASLCLFLTLVYVTFLFVPPLKRLYCGFVCNSMVPFTILSIVYIIAGWFLGEGNHECCLLRFGSLWHPIISFFAILAVSIVLSAVWPELFDCFGNAWKYLFVSVVLLGLVNFVAYVFIVRRSIKKFNKQVEKDKNDIIKECSALHEEFEKLRSVSEIADRYGANDSD